MSILAAALVPIWLGCSAEKSSQSCSGAFRVTDLQGNPVGVPIDDTFVFDPLAVRAVKVEVAAADWQWLNDNIAEEQYVPATVIYDGKRFEGAAIKYKGAWTTLTNCLDDEGKPTCPKLSMKLRFNKYDRCGRFYDLRRVIFNANVYDWTMMRELVSYGLMRHMEMMSSRVTHAQLQINDLPASLYTVVEAIDKEFIQDRDAFDRTDGNLYKGVWPQYPETDRYEAALRTNEDTPNVTRLLSFASAVDQASPEKFATEITPFVDLANIARMVAVSRAISDDDGMTRFWCHGDKSTPAECKNHNYYWYDQPKGRFRLLPWDLDTSLFEVKSSADVSPDWFALPPNCTIVHLCDVEKLDPCPFEPDAKVWPPQCDKLIQMSVTLHRAEFLDALGKLVAALDQSLMDMDTYQDLMTPAIQTDPRLPMTKAQWIEEIGWLKSIVQQQRDQIAASLAAP